MRRDVNAMHLAAASDGTGPTRSLSLSDTFPAFALWLHRVPGVGRNGTGRGRTNTGGNSNGKRQQVRMVLFLPLFLYFHLFFILLFFFSGHFFSDN